MLQYPCSPLHCPSAEWASKHIVHSPQRLCGLILTELWENNKAFCVILGVRGVQGLVPNYLLSSGHAVCLSEGEKKCCASHWVCVLLPWAQVSERPCSPQPLVGIHRLVVRLRVLLGCVQRTVLRHWRAPPKLDPIFLDSILGKFQCIRRWKKTTKRERER